ncbi:MAG: hypothetical protein ABIN00_08145 [candidate division WOR-3 bacterium]
MENPKGTGSLPAKKILAGICPTLSGEKKRKGIKRTEGMEKTSNCC